METNQSVQSHQSRSSLSCLKNLLRKILHLRLVLRALWYHPKKITHFRIWMVHRVRALMIWFNPKARGDLNHLSQLYYENPLASRSMKLTMLLANSINEWRPLWVDCFSDNRREAVRSLMILQRERKSCDDWESYTIQTNLTHFRATCYTIGKFRSSKRKS